jgi:hypothetical protein
MNNLQILVGNRPVTEYIHNNDRFIEGRNGSEFSLRIKNPFTYSRVMAVISVDGLSILDGEPASDKSTGYLIYGNQSVDIGGWRISDSEIRKFFFTKVGGSYNAKSGGDTSNVGVIAIKFFAEKYVAPKQQLYINQNLYPWNSYGGGFVNNTSTDDSALNKAFGASAASYNHAEVSAQLSSSGALRSSGLGIAPNWEETGFNRTVDSSPMGTGMGRTEVSKTYKVEFEPEKYAARTEIIYYDSLEGLQRRGIDIKRINYRPNPFPGNPGYCVEV